MEVKATAPTIPRRPSASHEYQRILNLSLGVGKAQFSIKEISAKPRVIRGDLPEPRKGLGKKGGPLSRGYLLSFGPFKALSAP